MPKWLERQLEKKTPTPKDPRERLEAILARVEITTKKDKKPKIRSKVMMDASGSRTVQVATPVVGKEGVSYSISTIDLGIATREKKVGNLKESMATVAHLIQQDKVSKDELKAQVADLKTYIQRWSSAKEMPTTSAAPQQLLSKEQIDKLEKRKNLEKTIES